MDCRLGCGACCIAPSINNPFYGMPNGKAAGERCVHLNADKLCDIFGKPERPALCGQFKAEPEFCGSNFEEAIQLITNIEQLSQ